MWWFFLISQFLSDTQGWEFTVKGQCRILLEKDGVILQDAANRQPLPSREVEIRRGDVLRSVKTDASGRVPVAGFGLLSLVHPGSEFHQPCWTLVQVPVPRSRLGRLSWKWLGPTAGLAFILIALFPVLRAGWRRREKARKPVAPEEAPEVEFTPSATRTFVPWRKAGFHGQVQVWESGLPLSGVEIAYSEHGNPGRAVADEDGRFFLPANAVDARFEKPGFHPVFVPRLRGQILVRLMSLPVRALWLLRQICRKYDHQRYAKLSPRQALTARIPPPEVIERLEKLAYAGGSPEPGEIERMEASLAPESEDPGG